RHVPQALAPVRRRHGGRGGPDAVEPSPRRGLPRRGGGVTVVSDPLFVRDTGPAVEREVASGLLRHGLLALPVAMAAGAIGWGVDGALSVAFAGALILLNFWVAASLLAWAARTSLSLL